MTRARVSPAAQARGRSRLHLRQARTCATRFIPQGREAARVAELGALLAANGHRRRATPSDRGPRNTWSDGTSSHIWHRLATLRNRLMLNQIVHIAEAPRAGTVVRTGRQARAFE
jgi:hypothetical protein